MSEKLRRCPFDGSLPVFGKYFWATGKLRVHYIKCPKCKIRILKINRSDLIKAWNTRAEPRLNKIKLCKCRDDSAGVMTVKRVNEDFHQCPRCGGLLPIIKPQKS